MKQLIGIRYLDKGRDPAVGLDCWGLFREFYRLFMGIQLPSFSDVYEDAFDHAAMAKAIDDNAPSAWVRVTEPQFGDGVRMRIEGNACHVGVYLGNDQMLHTQIGHDSAIDRVDSVRWKNRIVGYYRHIAVAGEGA